jgi:sulfite reductase (ferredoxin)
MSGSKPSKVEHVKRASSHLRGTIRQELDRRSTHFAEEDYQLLKFHGTYQQHDRDTATRRKQQGLEKDHQFMVRVRIPGGRLAAAQYLDLDDLAGKYANGTLCITTRQGIQLHGVLKENLKSAIAEINATLLTTLGACGDVVRNLMAPPAPIRDAAHERLAADARALSHCLLPRTRAYTKSGCIASRCRPALPRKSRSTANLSAPEVQNRTVHAGRQLCRRAGQ